MILQMLLVAQDTYALVCLGQAIHIDIYIKVDHALYIGDGIENIFHIHIKTMLI